MRTWTACVLAMLLVGCGKKPEPAPVPVKVDPAVSRLEPGSAALVIGMNADSTLAVTHDINGEWLPTGVPVGTRLNVIRDEEPDRPTGRQVTVGGWKDQPLKVNRKDLVPAK